MTEPRRDRLIFAAVAAGVLAYQISAVHRWVSQENRPPSWDPAVHLGTAMDYQEAWRDGRWLGLLLTKTRPGHPPYPPLYDYSLIPALSGPKPHIAVAWLNLGYWAILVFSAASIAWSLGGAWPAAAALAVLGLSPGLAYKFREAFPDVALAAWVTLAYALLLRSRFYESRPASAGVGLCAALAMNSKWGAFLYLLPALPPGLRAGPRRDNLALAVAIAILGCVPWYLVNGLPMLPRIWASVILGHHQGQPLTWTWANWWYYPDFLVRSFSWPGFLLLAAGSVLALLRSQGDARRWIALWLGFSYLFCTAVPSKDWRYFLPATAALPCLGAAGLPAPALGAACLIALYHQHELRRPEAGDWHNAEILETVERLRDHSRSLATLCVLPNHTSLNATSLGWQARHAGLCRVAMGGQETEIPEWSDFILAKTGDLGPFVADETYRILDQAEDPNSLFSRIFREAGRWPLPDGSEAVLYGQRRALPVIDRERYFPSVSIRSARLDGVRIRPQGAGRYAVEVSTLTLEKIPAPVRDIRLSLSGARLVEDSGKVYILGIATVTLESARLSYGSLSSALSARAHHAVTVSSEDGAVALYSSFGPVGANVAFKPSQRGDTLSIAVSSARLAGIPIPGASRIRRTSSLEPSAPYQPYKLVVGPARVLADRLEVGRPKAAKPRR